MMVEAEFVEQRVFCLCLFPLVEAKAFGSKLPTFRRRLCDPVDVCLGESNGLNLPELIYMLLQPCRYAKRIIATNTVAFGKFPPRCNRDGKRCADPVGASDVHPVSYDWCS